MSFIKRKAQGYKSNRRGSAAIEFALVAMPFILLVVSIIEISIMFAAHSIMIGAVQDAARAVRTGQVQVISDPDEADNFFREQICSHIPIKLVDCNEIQYSVEVLDSFAAANTTPQIDDEGNMADPGSDFGEEESVILINALYYHQMLTPLVGVFFADSSGNRKLLTATFVFQTEPYSIEDDVVL